MRAALRRARVGRVLLGHRRLFGSIVLGVAAFLLLPAHLPAQTRTILAWDIFSVIFLVWCAASFIDATPQRMAAHAEAQQEAEWTMFWIVVAGVLVSLAATLGEFSAMKTVAKSWRAVIVVLVAATLGLSWLLSHVLFALRYAHEYYERAPASGKFARGLQFPGDDAPDYWDFLYFALVLGMTFQVSDVQITAKPLRRLATVHGLLGFLFNTVIVALTVNIAAGLL